MRADGSYGSRSSWPPRWVNFVCRNSSARGVFVAASALADRGLEVVLSLVRGVDGAKAGAQRDSTDETAGVVFHAVLLRMKPCIGQ